MSQTFEIYSDEFKEILGPAPKLELMSDVFKFAEGVCWNPVKQDLVISDFPNDRVMHWSEAKGISVWRQPAQTANGNSVDAEGRIISCLTRGRSVVRHELDGSITVIADKYKGKKLTSPNDVCVKSDGTIWFTDPDYGSFAPEFGHMEPTEQDRNRVYRVDPKTGEIESVCQEFDKPNGLCFSPDESIFYVGDTGRTNGDFRPHQLMAFDVDSDGKTLKNPRVFAVIDPWVPDGFRVDTKGNLYITAGDGVQVYSPAGKKLGKIRTPECAGNVSFGMSDLQTLFIGATKSLFRIRLNATGAR